ncbi:chymotrypsin family serine protease [Limnochorda pilosa]|uniref:Peptidase S1 domain-containing protein n=1 Tax=Limnochorda pilosa TaxID=1555112 RepID=A0A0K2SQK8_LIMPI|nr:hypothetical protein [Limnochorda pilosa]BAS29418.1 hypothetical protein LIP_3610 [Limnochorda pilosa]
MDLLTILRKNRRHILQRPNVVGCGLGWKNQRGGSTGTRALCIYVEQKLPPEELSPRAMVPGRVETALTDVIEVGRVRALSLRTRRVRPAPGGVSIGHYHVSAGTLGAIVRDRTTGEWLILSNNHVLAGGTDGRDTRARAGDPVLQPGAHDGGTVERDRIGELVRFVPLQRRRAPASWWSRVLGVARGLPAEAVGVDANLVDAAVARPNERAWVSPEILGLGRIQGVVEAEPGMRVAKSGRTSAVTRGEVQATHVTMKVYMSDTDPVWFEEQILTTPMVEGGDSGSLLASGDRAVGLLFAGSDRASLANPIGAVLDALNVDLV